MIIQQNNIQGFIKIKVNYIINCIIRNNKFKNLNNNIKIHNIWDHNIKIKVKVIKVHRLSIILQGYF